MQRDVNVVQCSGGKSSKVLWVELQTKVREDFTITENSPILGPSPGWKRLVSLSHLTMINCPLNTVSRRIIGLQAHYCEIFAKARFKLYLWATYHTTLKVVAPQHPLCEIKSWLKLAAGVHNVLGPHYIYLCLVVTWGPLLPAAIHLLQVVTDYSRTPK